MSTEDEGLPRQDALYAGAPCGLVLTDPDGTIRRANSRFCAWVGYDVDELVGVRRFQDLFTVGGRIFHQTHWAPLLRMQGSITEVKLELQHRDGRPFPVVMNAVNREHGSRWFHEIALFVAEDRHRYERELLLERERAEQLLAAQVGSQQALTLADARLRVALETAQLHVWHVDPDPPVRRYDDGVAELLGLSGPEHISAERFLAHIDAADRDQEAAAFVAAMDPDNGTYRCVFRLNGADGIQRTVRATGDAAFDEQRRFLRLVGVLQDVTELSIQRAAAEERARIAEQMIGIVSHDLRNPLTAIKMGMQMLGNDALSPEKRARVIEHMDASIERARLLTDDLLDFTQVKLGSGLSIALQVVDIHRAVGQAVDELRMSFPGRAIVHSQEGDGACLADANRLTQLLGNLVGNAITYGAREQPVTVTSRVEPHTFTLEVHNWGAPIPSDLLPVLFEPMMRGAAVGADQRSVGLGLFIVRDIVRAHGGRITVSSSVEAGTMFRATFPRASKAAS